MSRKFLTNIDLAKNQILNAVLQLLSGAPSSPVEGQMYYDTTNHRPYFRNNSAWVDWTTGNSISDLTGDVSADGPGSVVATVNTVGGASAANVADAATKRHTQNTDAGTTVASFQVDSGNTGPRIRNASGIMEIRNAADNAYADLKVNNIFIAGTIDEVSSTQSNIADTAILLNSGIAVHTNNSDGTLAVKRLDIDDATRLDAKLVWNESNGLWQVLSPNSAGAIQTLGLTRKYSANVGDNIATSIVITHGMNTRDVQVTVYSATSTYDEVLPDVQHTSVDTVTLIFAIAPTTNQYRVVITG